MDDDSHLCRNRKYPAVIRDRAKRLRVTQTPAEALLWRLLQQNQSGMKFRRQHAVGRWILDFYCAALRLGIEVDGRMHLRTEVRANDHEKEAYLKSQGVTVLRYANEEIIAHPTQVLERVLLTAERLRNR